MDDTTLFKPEIYKALIERDPSLPRRRQMEDINGAVMMIYEDSRLIEAVKRMGQPINFASYAPFPTDYDGFGHLSIEPKRGLVVVRVTTNQFGEITKKEQYSTRPLGKVLQISVPVYEVNSYMVGDHAYMCEEVSGQPGHTPKNFDKSKIPTGREILLSLEEAVKTVL